MAKTSIPVAKIDYSGISSPSYDDVLLALQNAYRDIYGVDIVLDADTQDGQLLAVFALALHDTIDSSVSVYNDFSPATAQGAGLSSVIKVNGITRQIASHSTAVVRVVGAPGAVIQDGIISDNLSQDTRWALPVTITIPASGVNLGEVDVTAVCLEFGAITAPAGALTNIINPQLGWQEVSNEVAAIPGAPVEDDATLRKRQSRSASVAAQTPINAIYTAVADVSGVTRATVLENDNAFEDAQGIPAHSIAVVVSGGDIDEIATVVSLTKAPGVGTFGYISPITGRPTYVTVFDEHGIPNTIYLNPLIQIRIICRVIIAPFPGYITSTGGLVQQAMAAFYSNLNIAESAYLTRAYAPANLATHDAELGTGLTADQLDILSNTYHVTELAHGREDMLLLSGIEVGASTLRVTRPEYYAVGLIVYIQCNDTSWHRAMIVYHQPPIQYPPPAVAESFTFSPPMLREADAGNRVLVVGDLVPQDFWTAYFADSPDIIIHTEL